MRISDWSSDVCSSDLGKGPMDRLTGGEGSLKSKSPAKTVGSYWPYATTLFDYIRRAMPFDHPQSLTTDQVYAVSARSRPSGPSSPAAPRPARPKSCASPRSEEHTSELQSLMRISSAVFGLKKKKY